MAYDTLIVSEQKGIRTVTINRPDVLNALNRKVLEELSTVFSETETHADIRAVILTGTGDKSFVAGADIAEMKDVSPECARDLSHLGHIAFDRIADMKIPVIAAVNGFALGGGLELALACDYIYASDNAKLGLVEPSLALIPGFGGIARLSQRVGIAMAKELVYTSAKLSADDAKRIGLVNKVFAKGEVVRGAKASAEAICQQGPLAVAACKRLFKTNEDSGMAVANSMEQIYFGLINASDDANEGKTAFLEKRAPQYRGA